MDNTLKDTPAVSPIEAMRLFFTRYVDFKGRSRRSEFWWASLVTAVVSTVLGFVFKDVRIVSNIWAIAIFLPTLALSIRRLHDVGKSWVWYLWNLLPVVGQIILLVQYCKDGEEEANAWGGSPKYHA